MSSLTARLAADVALDADGRPVPVAPPGTPDWFRQSMAQLPRRRELSVDGAAIEVLEWGGGEGPGVLLMHGHGAHADWWRPIAPLLADVAGHVVAFSFSGMGGSSWRAHYDMEMFAREVRSVAVATGLLETGRRPHFVGHSFGCLPTMIAGQASAKAIAGLTLIDFYLPVPGYSAARPQQRKLRRYDSLDEGLARFRLSPEQDCRNPFLVDFIARRTLRRIDRDGDRHWTWCTDPNATIAVLHDDHRARFRGLTPPVTYLRGERSRLIDRDVLAHLRAIAPPHASFVAIPDADHHVLLDRPLALAAALRTIIALS